jgi:hypothetical protein
MKKAIARLLLLLVAGLFGASASWADSEYTPTEPEASKYSVEQATNVVQNGFSSCVQGQPWTVQVMPDGVLMTASNGGFNITQFRQLHDVKLTFVDSNAWISRARSLKLTVNGHVFGYAPPSKPMDYSTLVFICNGLGEDWTKVLGDGLLRLKLEYDKANDPEKMLKFQEEALRYRETNPKPALPEDARRLRVQAEGAVAAKRFLEAADKYGKAIEIAPWWPEAHFNRAVVLAELQNFDSAMAEMKRYLLLKPDAPDARQAQDFIYAWEAYPFEKK